MKRPQTICLLLLVAFQCAWAAESAWPELPTTKFVSGRAATDSDLAEGRAVFVLKRGDNTVGQPVALRIPQYALHKDDITGIWEPVIILQAESDGAQILIGYQLIGSNDRGVALREEFEFVGIDPPVERCNFLRGCDPP